MPLLNPCSEQYWDTTLAKFPAEQAVETIIIGGNSHLCCFAVTLDEFPPAYKGSELVNPDYVISWRHSVGVANTGLSSFRGSGFCILLARASDCLGFVLSFENWNPSEIKGMPESLLFCYPTLYSVWERHTRQRTNKQQVGLVSSQQCCFSLLFHPSGGEYCRSRCSLCSSLVLTLLSVLLPVSPLLQFTYLKEFWRVSKMFFCLGFLLSSPEPKLGLVAILFSLFLFSFPFSPASSCLSSIFVANLRDHSIWGSHLLSLDLVWPSMQHQGVLERSQERAGSGWEAAGQVGTAKTWRRWLERAE